MPDGFGLDHLPYGVFSPPDADPRVGVRIGDAVLDLAAATGLPELATSSLNAFMALGPEVWADTRAEARRLLEAGTATIPLRDVELHLPIEVADYVDFYASIHHATN